MYRIFWSEGKVDAVCRFEDETYLPWNSFSQTFDESDSLVVELRKWERENGALNLTGTVRAPTGASTPNWQGLLTELRGSALFNKVYVYSKLELSVNVCYTLILSTLNAASPNLNDLTFAIQDLRQVMGERLTAEDIDYVNAILLAYNFPSLLS